MFGNHFIVCLLCVIMLYVMLLRYVNMYKVMYALIQRCMSIPGSGQKWVHSFVHILLSP